MSLNERAILVVALVIAALVGADGCRERARPETLFTEAERLRLRYEKEASQQAIALYEQASTAWKRNGDNAQAARAAQGIGATYNQLGRLPSSVEGYAAALSLAVPAADPVLESEIRSDLGVAQALVADAEEAFDRAGEQCELALQSARRIAARRAVAAALNCLGEVAYYRQRPDAALVHYRDAEQAWEALGDSRGLAHTLLNQASLYSDFSRFDRARETYARATSLAVSLGDRREQAIALVGEGRLYVRRAEYEEALNTFGSALALLEPMGDAVWEGSALTGIGMVYQNVGDTRLALKYWERALQLFETAGLDAVSVDVLNSLGATYLASGDDREASSRFQRALTLADKLGIPRWRAFALRYIGVVHLVHHEPEQAMRSLTTSLDIQRTLGEEHDPRLEARTRADLGETHDMLGERVAALEQFQAAYDISRASGDRVAEARGLFGLARTSAGLGQLEAARRYVERSLDVVESLRTEVESRDLRASYFASVHQYNELQVDVLMRLHDAAPRRGLDREAFAASERARARSLLESLTQAGVNLRAGLDPDVLAREQALRRAFDDWGERRRRASAAEPGGPGMRALAEEYRDLQEREDRIQAEMRRTNPHYAALARPEPLGVTAVQAQVLDPGTVLLEYALGEERSYLWAISADAVTSHELPPRAVIEELAQRVYQGLTARLVASGTPAERARRIAQADGEYWRDATRLSEMLLAPAATAIARRRILVVADGTLQYVPFAALPVPGRRGDPVPLLAEHETVSLASASTLAVLRRETARRAPPPRAVAVLADPVFEPDDPRLRARRGNRPPPVPSTQAPEAAPPPRLASTRLEAEAIAAAAPRGRVAKKLDFDASRVTAMSAELGEYRVVHFATHGVFDNANPGLSGVMLSMFDDEGRPQNGFLALHDIYSLRLPADLVVLSACNTALGRQVRGEGLLGVVRGFMYAGARRVVASLWKVDDDATGEMMGRFYIEMLQHGRSPAAALREAQLAMWRQERWRPPFYWAAFVIQGEWQ